MPSYLDVDSSCYGDVALSKPAFNCRADIDDCKRCEFLPKEGNNAKTVPVPFLGENLLKEYEYQTSLIDLEFDSEYDSVTNYCSSVQGQNSLLSVSKGADIIADASILSKIAATLYNKNSDDFQWAVNCFKVGKIVVISADKSAPLSTTENMVNYRKERFKQLCLQTKEIGKSYLIMSSSLSKNNEKKLRLFYTVEEDCTVEDNLTYIDVHDSELGKGSDWTPKSVKWCLNAHFMGAENVMIGLYNRESNKLFRVVNIPTSVVERRCCLQWHVDACFSFLCAVLLKVKDLLDLEDLFIYAEFDRIDRDDFATTSGDSYEKRHHRKETNIVRAVYRPKSPRVEFFTYMDLLHEAKEQGADFNNNSDSMKSYASSICTAPYEDAPPPIRNRKCFLSAQFRRRFKEDLSSSRYY